MRGDFSQLVLDAGRYSRVLMQQGRVLMDADWNAAGAVLLAAQRTLAADLIGPHGGPAGSKPDDPDGLGFAIGATSTDGVADLSIGPGVYYVDGIRVAVRQDVPVTWSTQPFPPFPPPPVGTPASPPQLPPAPYLVYLDVWERHVSSLQDDTIRDVALGGPDTTSRAQVIWQVRVMSIADDADLLFRTDCQDFPLGDWRLRLAGNPPQLRVWAGGVTAQDTDPCLTAPDAAYRGAENSLYRVEVASVHPGSTDGNPATFVWSRENGSVAVAWTGTDGSDLRVIGVKDTAHGFSAGDWVELTWDALDLAGVAGVRARVTAVDGPVVTIDPSTATGAVAADPTLFGHATLRRWDQRERADQPLAGGAVPVQEATGNDDRQPLEDGIEIQFVAPGADQHPRSYRVGDYWVFPARVATADVVWPRDATGSPLPVAPHGIRHHHAPLAWWNPDAQGWIDLRHRFTQLTTCLPPT